VTDASDDFETPWTKRARIRAENVSKRVAKWKASWGVGPQPSFPKPPERYRKQQIPILTEEERAHFNSLDSAQQQEEILTDDRVMQQVVNNEHPELFFVAAGRAGWYGNTDIPPRQMIFWGEACGDPRRPVYMRGSRCERRARWISRYGAIYRVWNEIGERYWRLTKHTCPLGRRPHSECVSAFCKRMSHKGWNQSPGNTAHWHEDDVWIDGVRFIERWSYYLTKEQRDETNDIRETSAQVFFARWRAVHGRELVRPQNLDCKLARMLGGKTSERLQELVGVERNEFRLVASRKGLHASFKLQPIDRERDWLEAS
jgi:hypothetical protein